MPKDHSTTSARIGKKRVVDGSDAFRAELVKLMPGYEWTVHQSHSSACIEATGTQSSGFNRMSTLSVTRRIGDEGATYVVKSAGYGLRAPWLSTQFGRTLARALRHLQDHYEGREATYRAHASALADGRKVSA